MTTVLTDGDRLARSRMESILCNVAEERAVPICKRREEALEIGGVTLADHLYKVPTPLLCLGFIRRGEGMRKSGDIHCTVFCSPTARSILNAEKFGIQAAERLMRRAKGSKLGVYAPVERLGHECVKQLHACLAHYGHVEEVRFPRDFTDDTWPVWMASSLRTHDHRDAWRPCAHQLIAPPPEDMPSSFVLKGTNPSMGTDFDFLNDGTNLRAFFDFNTEGHCYEFIGAIGTDPKGAQRRMFC